MRYMEIMNLNQYINKIPEMVSYISLFVYVIWGISVVREDLESGKILNKKIIFAIKTTFILLLIHIANTISGYLGLSTNYLTIKFYQYYIIHIFYSIVFSYILWYGEIWPAGDSKFFIANMLFIPLINYKIKGFPSYLWITAMINIFVIAAIFSLFRYIRNNISLLNNKNPNAFKEIKEIYINRIKEMDIKSPGNILKIFSVFSIFTYKQFLNIILQKYIFNIFHRTDIFFFIMFFLWQKILKFFKSKIWSYIIIGGYIILLTTIIFLPSPIEFIKNIFLNAIKNTFTFGGIYFIGKTIFEDLIESHNKYYALKEEIKPGMILSSKELEIFRQNPVFEGIFNDHFRDGLTKEQAEALIKWMERHPDKNVKLEFVRSYPFASGIFVGCLFELIFQIEITRLLL